MISLLLGRLPVASPHAMHKQKLPFLVWRQEMEAVIRQRFGAHGLRVFRLLLLHPQLEQKQIAEKAMLPPKVSLPASALHVPSGHPIHSLPSPLMHALCTMNAAECCGTAAGTASMHSSCAACLHQNYAAVCAAVVMFSGAEGCRRCHVLCIVPRVLNVLCFAPA